MSSPLDPFALKFDSIEVDSTRAPTQAAIEHAMALAAVKREPSEPGFYLLDDAQGRFTVDRDVGVVSLADDALLETDRGAIFLVRLLVIEPSSTRYEMDMRLRITGRVPQMVGAEEFAKLAEMTAAPIPHLEPAIVAAKPAAPRLPWINYAATSTTHAAAPLGPESAAFGALIAPITPALALTQSDLVVSDPLPPPAHVGAAWSL
ncbi:MAG: hypothetical protein AB7O98_08820 [Hyphomonadaceae bacterium]